MNNFYTTLEEIAFKIDQFIFQKMNLWNLYFLCFVYIMLVYGLGTVPSDPTYLISKNPFINIFLEYPQAHYNYDSILMPMIAYFTGLNSTKLTFTLFNGLVIILGNILVIQVAKNRYSLDTAKLASILFVLSPLSTVLFTWIGYYDSMTYFLQSCLLFLSNPISIIIIGFLGGLNHFPVMLFSGVSLLSFKSISEKDKIQKKHLLIYCIGLGIGYALLKAYQHYFELEIDVDRLSFVKILGFQQILYHLFANFLTLIFSFYNILWIVVIFISHSLFFYNKKMFYVFVSSNVMYLTLTITVIDSTRIFSLLSYPLFFSSFFYVQNRIKTENSNAYISFRHFLVIVATIGLFIPRLIIWQGEIYFSVTWKFFTGIYELLH